MDEMIDTPPRGPALPPPTVPVVARAPRRSPAGVRVLWKVFAGLLVVASLVWGPYQVVTLLAHEERVETESFPAAGITRLEVDSSSGSVRIEASERDTIDVRAEISDGLRATGESREVLGGVVRLDSSCPNFGSDFCDVDYVVLVPLDLELVIDNDNGSVDVIGSAGRIDADSDNGSIELTGVSGSLRVSSDNGRVEGSQLTSPIVTADSSNGRVTLEFSTAPTTVVATSDNGRVDVVVPADGTAYGVDVQSDNGSETIEVPLDSASDRTIIANSDNGSVTVRTG